MSSAELKLIPVDLIQPGRFQPRKQFSKQAIQELADSIKAQGLIQPIVVRPIDETRYEIIAGERRWRATQLAGLKEIQCLVNNYHDEAAAAVSLIENLSRDDLNPIEVAQGYQRLMNEFDYIQEEVAAACGVSRTKVANALRLLNLDKEVQEMIIDGRLSDGHGKVLAGYSQMLQKDYAHLAIRYGWSIRKLESQLETLRQSTQKSPRAHRSIDVTALERLLSEQLNTEVHVDPHREGGWLKIRFYNNDTLAGILEKLELEY